MFIFDDNGIGICKDCKEKVFDMFYRATELSKGSGLGLYIVQQATQKLEGKIELESTEYVGTKLKISLPNLAKAIAISPAKTYHVNKEEQENRYRA